MPKTDTSVAATGPRPYETLVQRIRSQAELEASVSVSADTAFELQAAAIDKIAEADTLDALFDANVSAKLPGAEEAAAKGPLTILELEFRKTQEQYAKGGLGSYAFITSVDDRGEEFTWTTGAANIVASMWRIQELGLLNKPEKPRVKILGRATGNGTLYTVGRP